MVPTEKKKHQHKSQLSQLTETLNVFVMSNNTNASAIGNETLERQTNGLCNKFGRITAGENSACQDQLNQRNFDDKIGKALDNAVLTVQNLVHFDAILTVMDNVVKLRVETAVRSITGSSGRRPCNMIQNLG